MRINVKFYVKDHLQIPHLPIDKFNKELSFILPEIIFHFHFI